jgi:hypothetical protein
MSLPSIPQAMGDDSCSVVDPPLRGYFVGSSSLPHAGGRLPAEGPLGSGRRARSQKLPPKSTPTGGHLILICEILVDKPQPAIEAPLTQAMSMILRHAHARAEEVAMSHGHNMIRGGGLSSTLTAAAPPINHRCHRPQADVRRVHQTYQHRRPTLHVPGSPRFCPGPGVDDKVDGQTGRS